MVEGLSTTAAVIGVAGCAIASSKTLLKCCRDIKSAPGDINQSFTALQSLIITLENVRQAGAQLPPSRTFPPHFLRRLDECLSDLRKTETRVGSVNTKLSKKGNGKARKAYETAKWLLLREREMDIFWKRMESYEREFSLQLFATVLTTTGSPTAPSFPLLPAHSGPATGPENSCALNPAQPASSRRGATRSSSSPSKVLPTHLENLSCITTRGYSSGLKCPKSATSWQSIRSSQIQQWIFLCFELTLRFGPVITCDKVGAGRRTTGFGLTFSANFPQLYRKRVEGAIYLAILSVLCRKKLTLSFEIGCPRVVPRSADVFHHVQAGACAEVQALFGTKRASPGDTTPFGITPLHLAAVTGNCDMISLLVQEGSDVNAADVYGETPLHRAVSKENNYDVARLLIENGADLANVSVDQRTPVHALFNDTVENILSREDWVEVMFPDFQGMTVLHYLAWTSKISAKMFEKCQMRGLVDLWAVDYSGKNCLHYAAMRGNIDVLTYLLEKAPQGQIQATDHVGRTALHFAVRSIRFEAIDLLVEHGSNLYAKDTLQRTALHCAAECSNLQAAQRLLNLGQAEHFFSLDKNGHLPSQLVRGRNAARTREYLAAIESTLLSQHGPWERSAGSSHSDLCHNFFPISSCPMRSSPLYWHTFFSNLWVFFSLALVWILFVSNSSAITVLSALFRPLFG